MFNKFISKFALLVVFGSASAAETQSELALEVGGVHYTKETRKPIIWKPISNRLSRYSLMLPTHGIQEAIQYRDTAPLFYLSHLHDNGLSLVADEYSAFTFYIKPKQSSVHYRHALTKAVTVNIGITQEQDVITPSIAGEVLTITSHKGLQQGSLTLSNSSMDVFLARTQLSANETHEKIWTISSTLNQSRVGYGWRWFDVIRDGNLLAEFGFSDADPLLGLQLEHRFHDTTAYFGVSGNTNSRKSKVFLGLKIKFEKNTMMRIESENNLITGAARSLNRQRRNELQRLWRSNVKLIDQQTNSTF